MTVGANGLHEGLPRIAPGIEVMALPKVVADEFSKIVGSHTAVGKQQNTVVGIGLVAHGRLVKETLDSLGVPDFVDDFLFIGSHHRSRWRTGRYHTAAVAIVHTGSTDRGIASNILN